jgi:hypothetical protein
MSWSGAGSNAVVEHGTAGAASDRRAGRSTRTRPRGRGKYLLADDNSATAAARVPVADSRCNGAANGAAARGASRAGDLTPGATLTAGVAYYLSDTPGGVSARSRTWRAGEYPTIVGIATSTSVLAVQFHESGVAL